MPCFDSTPFRPMVTNKTQETNYALGLSGDSSQGEVIGFAQLAKLLDMHNLWADTFTKRFSKVVRFFRLGSQYLLFCATLSTV